jgi:hypothetical protein
MSCNFLPKAHIDALVSYATSQPSGICSTAYRIIGGEYQWRAVDTLRSRQHEYGYIDADELGRTLWVANAQSVNARYEDSSCAARVAEAEAYRFTPVSLVTIADNATPGDEDEDDRIARTILKAISGYEYQTMELPGWETSWAAAWAREMRECAAGHLARPSDAWEITEDMTKPGRRVA